MFLILWYLCFVEKSASPAACINSQHHDDRRRQGSSPRGPPTRGIHRQPSPHSTPSVHSSRSCPRPTRCKTVLLAVACWCILYIYDWHTFSFVTLSQLVMLSFCSRVTGLYVDRSLYLTEIPFLLWNCHKFCW